MKTWQVCPECGAVTYIWRDYEQRMGMLPNTQIRASMLNHADGSPCIFGEQVRCGKCGTTRTDLLLPKHMRTGEEVPV